MQNKQYPANNAIVTSNEVAGEIQKPALPRQQPFHPLCGHNPCYPNKRLKTCLESMFDALTLDACDQLMQPK